MRNILKENLVSVERFSSNKYLSKQEIKDALDICMVKIDRNIEIYGELFPYPATKNNTYDVMDNVEWTNGFWTGILWLAYEYSNCDKYRLLAEKHIESFHNRILNNIEVDHHDLGFLYIPSCVSAYKLTGNKLAYNAAVMAADRLVKRYQPIGEFIQAWGELGAEDNYRLIVDCLLNIPILYWASEVTGDKKYREIAKKHFNTTIKNAIRDNASAFHTFYFDTKTGNPLRGKTRQGFSDDSSWARGQAWIIYGVALNYFYNRNDELIEIFEAVSNYFVNRLPKDFICYWDLIFGDDSGQCRDSSSAAIAVCGLNLMDKFIPESNGSKSIYRNVQHAILRSLIENYSLSLTDGASALINHGVYSWHSGKGVDEGNIWGDYFYIEALIRFYKDWKMYW